MLPKPFTVKNVRFSEKEQELLDYANSLDNFSGHMKRLLRNELEDVKPSTNIRMESNRIDTKIIKHSSENTFNIIEEIKSEEENINIPKQTILNVLNI